LASSVLLPLALAGLLALRLRASGWNGDESPAPFISREPDPVERFRTRRRPGRDLEETPSAAVPPEEIAPVRAFGRLDPWTVGLFFLLMFLAVARLAGGTAPDARDLALLGPFASICVLLLPGARAQKIGFALAI